MRESLERVSSVGLKTQFLFRVTVFKCQDCGRKLLSLEKEANFSECPECTGGILHAVVEEEVQDFPFDIPDMAGSLDLKEIWNSCPEESRRMIAGADFDDSEFVRGALVSVFAGFLCKAVGTDPEPEEIKGVAKCKRRRRQLLEKASSSTVRTGHKLRGSEWVRGIAVAFWG